MFASFMYNSEQIVITNGASIVYIRIFAFSHGADMDLTAGKWDCKHAGSRETGP